MPKLFVIAFSSILVLGLAVQEAALATQVTQGITLATAIATIIAAIFVGWVNVIAARSAARKAIAPIAEDVSAIKAHVNSEKTRDLGVIASKDLQIKLLEQMIEEQKRSSALLAQAAATRELGQVVAQAAIAGAAIPSGAATAPPVLDAIEQNTNQTAANTAKTDVAVQALQDKG